MGARDHPSGWVDDTDAQRGELLRMGAERRKQQEEQDANTRLHHGYLQKGPVLTGALFAGPTLISGWASLAGCKSGCGPRSVDHALGPR